MDNYSLADLAAVKDGGFGGSGSWLFFIVILFLFMGGNWGGNAGANLSSQFSDQTSALNQQQILLSSANNNYETSRLISQLGSDIMQQNNTNLVNAIQGFNQIGSKLDALGYQLQSCCCEIKTQMLQDRLDSANSALVAAQGAINNANQSQYLLSMLGKYTPGGATATT